MSAFSPIQTEYGEILLSLHIQSECGKIRTRITPSTDTFYAVKAKRKSPTNNFKFPFLNKGVKLINVPGIFHDPSVKAYLPVNIKFDDPTIFYLLNNPIRSKIFNFDRFIHNLDVKAFLLDDSILSCNCKDSGFTDKDHLHTVTGNLGDIK